MLLSGDMPLGFNTETVSFSDVPNPTAISLTCDVSPSSVSPGWPVTVSGSATYNDGGGSVPAATVEISVGGQQYTASISNGSYTQDIYAPNSQGGYTVSAHAYDGVGRTGNASDTLTVQSDGGGSDWDIDYNYICADIDTQGSFPQEYPDDIRDVFSSDDGQVYDYIMFSDIEDQHSVSFRWYRPDGTHHFTWNGSFGVDGFIYYNWYVYSSINLAGSSPEDIEGRWKVKVYVDGDYVETKRFTIRYEFKEHKMAEDVQGSDPWDAINEKSVFSQTDVKALTWYKMDDVAEQLEMKWSFYEPNGSLYSETTYTGDDPGSGSWFTWHKFWAWIDVNGASAANKCGDWSVDVFVKDTYGNWDKEYTDHFTIVENPNQAPSISVAASPTEPLETQAITLSVSASDNTYLQKVVLHWNDGAVHSELWGNITSPSLEQSRGIGSYPSGQQIEYWAEVWDTSGNHKESEHKFITVQPDIPSKPDTPNGEFIAKSVRSAHT